LRKGCSVVLPVRFIEIERQEEARFVQEQRIDARDKRLALAIFAGQVPANDVVGHGQESAVLTVRALNPRFLTDAAHPLVGAGRRVS
jgi:hypothetical protein